MEKFFPKSEGLDATIKKKPKEDPVGVFLSRYGETLDVTHAVTGRIDFSYLTPFQKAESMWAIFQDVRETTNKFGRKQTEEEVSAKELDELRIGLGAIKNLYEDEDVKKVYLDNCQRYLKESESINGDAEKRSALVREIDKDQKLVNVCVRKMFSERGKASSELDILLLETSRRRLKKKQDELDQLVNSNPELGALNQYEDIRQRAKELQGNGFIWSQSRKKLLEGLEEAALSGKPVLLSGESGTGKTRLVEQASLLLTGRTCNQTPGRNTRFQDLVAKPKIYPGKETYYEYGAIGRAATGRSSTLEDAEQNQGEIVAEDEFNLKEEGDQTDCLARVSSWTPGKTVTMPVTNQKVKIAPNFLYCAMVNLADERYARNKIPPEVLRKFSKVDVGFLEQSAQNPEIYEAILAALLDKNGRLRVAKGEVTPAYEFREETRTVEEGRQKTKQIVNIRELKKTEKKDGKVVAAGGFAWRLANALDQINKSFSHEETVLKVKGDAQFLQDLIIDIGTVLGWMKEYRTMGRGKSLEEFVTNKIQKEFLSREAYPKEDRELVKEFLKHFDIDPDNEADDSGKKKTGQEFEIMTPLEIGLLSPRVKYEKVVNEEPILTESCFITPEGNRVEYRIEPMEHGDQKIVPGQIFKMGDMLYEFLGVSKENGDPVIIPYVSHDKKSNIDTRKETASTTMKTKWHNPETGQEQTIEIDLEKTLSEQKVFYKSRLNLEIDEREVMSIWNKNYTEIKSEIEKYGYNQVLIVPDNLPEEESLNHSLIETMEENVSGKKKGKKKQVAATYEGGDFKSGGSFAGVRNSYTPKYRLVLTHGIQNIGDHAILKATRNKNVMQVTGLDMDEVNRRIASGEELPVNCEIEINGRKVKIEAEGESLEDYIIQQRMHFDKTGEHLDAKNNSYARLLKSFSGSRVVSSFWHPDDRRLDVSAHDPGSAYGALGLRLSRSFS